MNLVDHIKDILLLNFTCPTAPSEMCMQPPRLCDGKILAVMADAAVSVDQTSNSARNKGSSQYKMTRTEMKVGKLTKPV
jgi:hypothetical protein